MKQNCKTYIAKMFSKSNHLLILIPIAFLLLPAECRLRVPFRGFESLSPKVHACSSSTVDPGEPLFLTPLIEGGKLEEARSSASVKHEAFGDTQSYSGYLTVNKTHNTNLFFWFFPAENDYPNAPVILWLQGGPGDSSLIGLFAENGPFNLSSDCVITKRDHRWTEKHSVIYIDSPAGTGFSFTDESGLSTEQTQISEELYEALTQFFTLFPNLQTSKFFIAGESYGGKYVPSLAYQIHQKNPTAKLNINLQGLAIDSGMSDPINQHDFADYFYQVGLIDEKNVSDFIKLQDDLTSLIKNQDWPQGYLAFVTILVRMLETSEAGNHYYYLDARDVDTEVKQYIRAFVEQNDIRAALHVGKNDYSNGQVLYEHMASDFMKSVADKVSELLKHYRILLYNGQVDIITPYPLMVNYLQHLKFDGDKDYKVAARYIWKVEDEVAGYVKYAGRLTEVLVRNAGHMVAYNQPKWCNDLITKFVRSKPIH